MLLIFSVTAAAQTYTLDPAKSTLAVLVSYDRDALIAGHDHVVHPRHFEGTVRWEPGACDIKISFPVAALVVDEGSRALFSLTGETSSSDKTKIIKNLRGDHVLSADHFPEISFSSTQCTQRSDGVMVTGDLRLHGVSHTVTAIMDVTHNHREFHATGSFRGTHADWQLKPFSALLGSLRNAPDLLFKVDVHGPPVGTSPAGD